MFLFLWLEDRKNELTCLIVFAIELGSKTLEMEFWDKYFMTPDFKFYNKTVIDYFGGQYGIYWPSTSHIDFGFASVNI